MITTSIFVKMCKQPSEKGLQYWNKGKFMWEKFIYILLELNFIPVIRDNGSITQWYIHVVKGNKLGKSGDNLNNVNRLLVIIVGHCLVIQVFYYLSYLWVFTCDLFTCGGKGDISYQRKYSTVRQRFFNICVRKQTMICLQTTIQCLVHVSTIPDQALQHFM